MITQMTTPTADRPTINSAGDALIGPLVILLHDLAHVIELLNDAQYTQKPVGVIHSSIGGHVRHCLDHVSSLVSAARTGVLDYDHRERGTPIESDRYVTIAAIAMLIDRLRAIRPADHDRPLAIRMLVSADGEPLTLVTSLGREAAYVVSHTIHHEAIISAMVTTLGGWIPERFGYAPSTIAHMQRCR